MSFDKYYLSLFLSFYQDIFLIYGNIYDLLCNIFTFNFSPLSFSACFYRKFYVSYCIIQRNCAKI